MGNPWEPQWISTTWNAVNHRVHSLDLSPLPLPFSNGRAEHAALRDAVSTYSRCLTFSIRMNEIKVRGGKNTMGEEGSFRIFLAHFFFFFGNTLRRKKGYHELATLIIIVRGEIIVYRTASNVAKGDFFPRSIRLLFDPFTPVQSAKPMTRTDVKAPRIPRVEFILFKKWLH